MMTKMNQAKTMLMSILSAAILILGFPACSADEFDNPVNNNPLGNQIIGKFYLLYNAEGTIDGIFSTIELPHDYARVVETYEFHQDGTGIWNRYFIDNGSNEPFADLGGGSGGLGHFTFKTTADGIVNVTLDNVESAPTPDPYGPYFRQMTYADGKLSGFGIDGQAITMDKAGFVELALFSTWHKKLHGGADADDDSENINAKDFTPENWRNQGAIYIYDGVGAITDANGLPGYTKVNMPWRNSVTNLPDGFCDNITPQNGWEWVYNLCGSRTTTNLNYFFLYNKYTGILRVFYYMPKMSKVGNDHAWKVSLGNEIAQHSLWGYALPSTANIKDRSAIAQTATNVMIDYVSPWCELPDNSDGQIIPREGWWAFDIDLSLYRPDTDLSKQNIKLEMLSWNLQHISLYSTMSADIDGNIKQIIKNTGSKSKSSSIVKGILSGIQGVFSFASGIAGFATGNPAAGFSGLANCIGCGNSIAGLGGGAQIQPFEAEVSLGMNGTINTDGFIQNSEVTMGVPNYTIGLTSFDRKSCPSFAEGVWNIKNYPVVYVIDDANIHFNYDYYTTLYFFDPSSIELELNPNVFPESEIEWMQVDATCVNTAQNGWVGTDTYRNAFGLNSRRLGLTIKPWDKIFYNETVLHPYHDFLYWSDDKGEMKYPVTMLEEDKGGGTYSIKGRGVENAYAIEPGPRLYYDEMPIVPALEVNVIVQVKLKGHDQPFVYSRNYLPELKALHQKDCDAAYEQIKSHQLSPKQEGHHASYDYQVERIGKYIGKMKEDDIRALYIDF